MSVFLDLFLFQANTFLAFFRISNILNAYSQLWPKRTSGVVFFNQLQKTLAQSLCSLFKKSRTVSAFSHSETAVVNCIP